MSILIKNMGIPEDCFSCPLKEEGYCNLTNAYAVFINERDSDCPLVALPEEHGRLIDANKLIRDINKYHVSDGKFQHWVEVQSTVIEAEDE